MEKMKQQTCICGYKEKVHPIYTCGPDGKISFTCGKFQSQETKLRQSKGETPIRAIRSLSEDKTPDTSFSSIIAELRDYKKDIISLVELETTNKYGFDDLLKKLNRLCNYQNKYIFEKAQKLVDENYIEKKDVLKAIENLSRYDSDEGVYLYVEQLKKELGLK